MDVLSLIGIIIGFAAIFGGNYLDGGQLNTFLNLPAAVVVVGGTLGAAMLQTSKVQLVFALQRLRWVLYPPQQQAASWSNKIIEWAKQARKLGLLGLEDNADRDALIALYNATDGANWTNTWDLDADITTWYGITLDEDGSVTHIELSNNNLIGFIPSEIGNLTNLISPKTPYKRAF